MRSYLRAKTNLAIVCGLAMSAAGTVSAQNYEVRFGGPNTQEIAYDIVETASAGSVAVGSIDTRGGDIYAVRFNAFGTRLWSRAIGGTQNDTGYSVTATDDGGFVIAAEVQSNLPAAGLTTAGQTQRGWPCPLVQCLHRHNDRSCTHASARTRGHRDPE